MSVVAGQKILLCYKSRGKETTHHYPSSPPLVRVLRIAHQSLHSHCLQSMSKDSSCLSVCVCVPVCMCVGDVFPRTPLPESLLCAALLLSWSLCCSCSSSAFLSGLSGVEAVRCPCNGLTVKEVPPLLKLTPSPAFKAAPTRVMQGHQTASSLSAWLLLSLSLTVSASLPFPLYLPPSLPPLSFSLSVLH